jgi:DNA-nicking Smr family endonuclease
MGDVAPLRKADKAAIDPPRPLPIARQHLADEQAALRESLSDEFTIESLLDTDEALSYARAGIGPDVVRKLRRGNWIIQGQLDLHGLRTDEARDALGEFLRTSVKARPALRTRHSRQGTGLGQQEPVLKNKVRNWLVQKEEVIAFCQARAADGGTGALVVLLTGKLIARFPFCKRKRNCKNKRPATSRPFIMMRKFKPRRCRSRRYECG